MDESRLKALVRRGCGAIDRDIMPHDFRAGVPNRLCSVARLAGGSIDVDRVAMLGGWSQGSYHMATYDVPETAMPNAQLGVRLICS